MAFDRGGSSPSSSSSQPERNKATARRWPRLGRSWRVASAKAGLVLSLACYTFAHRPESLASAIKSARQKDVPSERFSEAKRCRLQATSKARSFIRRRWPPARLQSARANSRTRTQLANSCQQSICCSEPMQRAGLASCVRHARPSTNIRRGFTGNGSRDRSAACLSVGLPDEWSARVATNAVSRHVYH